MSTKQSRIEICSLIMATLEEDTRALDKTPVTSYALGTVFGSLMADVATLAKVVKEDMEDDT